MEDIDFVVVLSRWIHIMAAIVAIGAVAFQRFALLPVAKQILSDEKQQELREGIRRRWAKFVHGCIALLLVTGGLNFVWLAMPPKVEPMPYHGIFGVKFFAAMGIFFLATALTGRSPGFAHFREKGRKWLSVILVLAVVVVLLSGMLNQIRASGGAVVLPATTTAPE
jgi:hypothetical protein